MQPLRNGNHVRLTDAAVRHHATPTDATTPVEYALRRDADMQRLRDLRGNVMHVAPWNVPWPVSVTWDDGTSGYYDEDELEVCDDV